MLKTTPTPTPTTTQILNNIKAKKNNTQKKKNENTNHKQMKPHPNTYLPHLLLKLCGDIESNPVPMPKNLLQTMERQLNDNKQHR